MNKIPSWINNLSLRLLAPDSIALRRAVAASESGSLKYKQAFYRSVHQLKIDF